MRDVRTYGNMWYHDRQCRRAFPTERRIPCSQIEQDGKSSCGCQCSAGDIKLSKTMLSYPSSSKAKGVQLFIAWLYDSSLQLWSACLVEKVLPQRMGRDKHRKVSNDDISVRYLVE